MKELSVSDLEKYYEETILPKYNLRLTNIVWKDHAMISPDTFAHYFSANNSGYILVFEDFPNSSNYITEDNEFIPAIGYEEYGRIVIEATEPDGYIENVTGYFSLHHDKPLNI